MYKSVESIRVVQRTHVYYSLGTCYTLLTLLTCDELRNGRKSLGGECICELKRELIPWGSLYSNISSCRKENAFYVHNEFK